MYSIVSLEDVDARELEGESPTLRSVGHELILMSMTVYRWDRKSIRGLTGADS